LIICRIDRDIRVAGSRKHAAKLKPDRTKSEIETTETLIFICAALKHLRGSDLSPEDAPHSGFCKTRPVLISQFTVLVSDLDQIASLAENAN
jgi:hypothetical protein